MPYFVYKVFSNRTLEPVDAHEKYRDAKVRARELRAESKDDDDFTFRLIYARNETEAERLLTQKREPRPLGEDS